MEEQCLAKELKNTVLTVIKAHIVNLTFSCVVLADLKACLLLSELLDVPGQAGAGVTVRNMYSSLSN